MKKSIIERDERIVNEILGNGNLTIADKVRLISLYRVSVHDSGKIAGACSCDSSCGVCRFCAAMRAAALYDPAIICGLCYDAAQEAYRASMARRHALNARIMSACVYPEELLAILPVSGILRFNSSGDLTGEVMARNYIRIAKTHPYAACGFWAKNIPAAQAALDAEGKPENLVMIQSSCRIGEQAELARGFDKVFTVYATEAALLDAVQGGAHECNGRKCAECGWACYRQGGAVHVAEYLRTSAKRRAELVAAGVK